MPAVFIPLPPSMTRNTPEFAKIQHPSKGNRLPKTMGCADFWTTGIVTFTNSDSLEPRGKFESSGAPDHAFVTRVVEEVFEVQSNGEPAA
jgi:hypothetical protein